MGSVAAPVVPLSPTMPKECGVGLAEATKLENKIALKIAIKMGIGAQITPRKPQPLVYEIGYIL